MFAMNGKRKHDICVTFQDPKTISAWAASSSDNLRLKMETTGGALNASWPGWNRQNPVWQ